MKQEAGNRRPLFDGLWQWDRSAPVPKWQMVSAALGTAMPIVFGALVGRAEIGFIIALGSLFIVPPDGDVPLKAAVTPYARVVFTGFAATSLGAWVGPHHSLTASLILVVMNGLVALAGGINRTLAANSVRFAIFFMIGTGISLPTQTHPLWVGLFSSLGAVWAALISLFFPNMKKEPSRRSLSALDSKADFHAQMRYWLVRLKTFRAWSYPIRLVLCLSLAQCIQLLLKSPHAYWISLTIVLVLQRNAANGTSRIFQRATGTFFGVLLGAAVLAFPLSMPWLVLIVACIGGVRRYLKVRNYAVYSMAMTPLLFILLNRGKQISFDLMVDRLIYTLVGCIIALVFDYWLWTVGEKRQKTAKK